MRAALWFLALFAVAVAVALFAGSNPGTVTLFWPPWRVDLSLNLVLVALTVIGVVMHLALRALAALFEMPRQARRWRAQQRERAIHAALVDAQAQLLAGRFLRARKSAQLVLAREQALADSEAPLAHSAQLRVLTHVIAAEAAHALQDTVRRDEHLRLALAGGDLRGSAAVQEVREGARLRAARWAVEDRDADAALGWLDGLPQGAARRTLALRTRLRAARLARQTAQALETARLLAKHRAFSPAAARSIVRGLAGELIAGAHDTTQLQRVWEGLDPAERLMPELASEAARRLVRLGGDARTARAWLLPVWDRLLTDADALSAEVRRQVLRAVEASLGAGDDDEWLARIEAAQQRLPRDAGLQYLAGVACLRRQLWGRAQLLLGQAAQALDDEAMRRDAWRELGRLAEQRGDGDAATLAWKRAATGT